MGNRSAESIHFTTEAFRRAFFDRAALMGDPDIAKIHVAQLLDNKYGAAWRDSIDAEHATASKELKRPAIFSEMEQYAAAHPPAFDDSRIAAHHTRFRGGCGRKRGRGHYDPQRLVRSAGHGGGPGVLLNDEMDDFSTRNRARRIPTV